MRALVYTEPFNVAVRALPEPEAGPHEVLVRVAACGICGSDVHGFQGKSRIRIPPMVMGHEFSGRIVSVGARVGESLTGQRVVVQPVVGCGTCPYCLNGRPNICPRRELIGGQRQGAFAEYVRAPARAIYPISDSLSNTAATFVEPLANSVHMLALGGGALDRDVVVLGAGTLGLLTIGLARVAGARRIVATDVDGSRLDVAQRLGATETVDPRGEHAVEAILSATCGGADLVIDAAGFTTSRQQAVAVAAAGGCVVLLGLADPTSELSMFDIINREITVRGSYSSTDAEFRHAISVLEDGKIEVDSWSQNASLEDGQRCFDTLSTHGEGPIKVIFSMAD